MPRATLFALSSAFCVLLLTGCGGEIARIDGLPQTRDVSGVDWPRLVDTPAAPIDALLPQTGAQTLAALSETRDSVLNRAAQPDTARITTDDLGSRVARIQQQVQRPAPGVDQAELADRAARVSALRNSPTGISDRTALQARAAQVTAQTRYNYGGVNREELAQRAQRIAAVVSAPPEERLPLTARRTEETAAPAPAPRPVARRPELDTPVISDDFRKRAEEALKRARERADAR